MKSCPRCNRVYTEDDLNFCLDDGELLQQYSDEQPTRPLSGAEPPPTIMMDSPRVTNPIGWDAGHNVGGPVGQWQGNQPQVHPTQVFGHTVPGLYRASLDQSMPTVALILGVLSVTTVCCFGGFYFGLPAAVLGFIGMKNVEKEPTRYGGRGIAIAGMVIGIVTFLIGVLHAISAVASSL